MPLLAGTGASPHGPESQFAQIFAASYGKGQKDIYQIERERESERDCEMKRLLCVYIYIYLHMDLNR